MIFELHLMFFQLLFESFQFKLALLHVSSFLHDSLQLIFGVLDLLLELSILQSNNSDSRIKLFLLVC